jgi:hypothetical protein
MGDVWPLPDEVWTALPPGSYVVWVGEDRPAVEVVKMRVLVADVLEVATRHGGTIRLIGDAELRRGEWAIGHPWR